VDVFAVDGWEVDEQLGAPGIAPITLYAARVD
jgi:hypothetical protein